MEGNPVVRGLFIEAENEKVFFYSSGWQEVFVINETVHAHGQFENVYDTVSIRIIEVAADGFAR